MSASLLMGGTASVTAAKVPADEEVKAIAPEAAKTAEVGLVFNGERLQQKGLLIGETTMVPVTVLRDVMDLPITYDYSTFTYNVGAGASQLNLTTSEYGVVTSVNQFYMGGIHSEYSAVNLQGRLYVPFRLLNDILGFQGAYDTAAQTLVLEKRETNPIQITTGTLTQKTEDLEMQIRYPQITGLADVKVQQKMNEALKAKADAFAKEGMERSTHRNSELVPFPYSYNANYVVTYNQDGVLSVLIDQTTYTGGEDPVQREAMTFSLKDGHRIDLNELLPQDSGSQEKLYPILAQRIQQDGSQISLDQMESSLHYYVSGAGLQFYFGETGPDSFAKGIRTYKVPFNELLPAGADPFAAFK